MKASHWVLGPTLAVAMLATSCSSGNEMTRSEIDAANRAKPPSAEQMNVIQKSAANQAEVAKAEQRAWAKAHPDKVATINAARAKAGLPPLGQ